MAVISPLCRQRGITGPSRSAPVDTLLVLDIRPHTPCFGASDHAGVTQHVIKIKVRMLQVTGDGAPDKNGAPMRHTIVVSRPQIPFVQLATNLVGRVV